MGHFNAIDWPKIYSTIKQNPYHSFQPIDKKSYFAILLEFYMECVRYSDAKFEFGLDAAGNLHLIDGFGCCVISCLLASSQ